MNTILTDDEIATAIAHLYAGPEVLAMALPDELHSARAVEAAVLAKLAQQAARQRVPDGWKLVPMESTIKQLAAMGPAIRACYELDGKNGNVRDVYAAMLAAAPEAPAQASAVDERAVHRAAFDDMRSAVRFAPSSAYWSAKLREFFGPDARSGIDALEKQLREARAALAKKGGK